MFDENETAEQIRARRNAAKMEYGRLFDTISGILFQHDPIGINFDDNTDEYEPEVETILPRLRSCRSSDDALNVIYDEFQKWFDGDAGPREAYTEISKEVWAAWSASELAGN